MKCTRCNGTGFLNLNQVDGATLDSFYRNDQDFSIILYWLEETSLGSHDVSVCDCCGDGENWYYTPGFHSEYITYPTNSGIPLCA